MVGHYQIQRLDAPHGERQANSRSPGRFFVSHELKMVFARLFLNYDIKHLPERPRPFWFGRTFVPPTDACIEVKRRRVDA